MEVKIEKQLNIIWKKILQWIPEVAGALVLLIIGILIIRYIKKRLKKFPIWKNYDPSISTFVITSINVAFYIILFISVAAMLGVPTTSMIAVLGSVGIAVGLGLQSHLSNIAAGIEILILKPIKSGDFVLIDGYTGTVKKVAFFFTYINTIDNRLVIIPNNDIMNKPLVNYTAENYRKLDEVIGISYSSNIKLAKEIIYKILSEDERVLYEPDPPMVVVSKLGESSIEITVRAWTKTENLLDLRFWFFERVKSEFDLAGIIIPFPQRDIHIYENK